MKDLAKHQAAMRERIAKNPPPKVGTSSEAFRIINEYSFSSFRESHLTLETLRAMARIRELKRRGGRMCPYCLAGVHHGCSVKLCTCVCNEPHKGIPAWSPDLDVLGVPNETPLRGSDAGLNGSQNAQLCALPQTHST